MLTVAAFRCEIHQIACLFANRSALCEFSLTCGTRDSFATRVTIWPQTASKVSLRCHILTAVAGLHGSPPAPISATVDFWISRSCGLLNGIGPAARPCGSVLALLELESQHIEQAIDPVRERPEQRLLLERRDIQMKAQKIDKLGAAQPTLLDYRAPGLLSRRAEVAEQHLAQRVHRLGVAIERVGPHRAPGHFRQPIRTFANL